MWRSATARVPTLDGGGRAGRGARGAGARRRNAPAGAPGLPRPAQRCAPVRRGRAARERARAAGADRRRAAGAAVRSTAARSHVELDLAPAGGYLGRARRARGAGGRPQPGCGPRAAVGGGRGCGPRVGLGGPRRAAQRGPGRFPRSPRRGEPACDAGVRCRLPPVGGRADRAGRPRGALRSRVGGAEGGRAVRAPGGARTAGDQLGAVRRARAGQGLLDAVRRHDMRMVGPNCLGIANTDPAVRLDATFAEPAPAGAVGLVTQSGGVAIAVQHELGRLGLGVSTAVSTGDKYDVSGNDMLLWWHGDERTRLAVLYLESFGNPRKFSRFARRLAERMPVRHGPVGQLRGRAAGRGVAHRVHGHAARDPRRAVPAGGRAGRRPARRAHPSWSRRCPGSRCPQAGGQRSSATPAGSGCSPRTRARRTGWSCRALSDRTQRALRRLLPARRGDGNPVDTTAVVPPDGVRLRGVRRPRRPGRGRGPRGHGGHRAHRPVPRRRLRGGRRRASRWSRSGSARRST